MAWSASPALIGETLGHGPKTGPDFTAVTTDTRSLSSGSLFVALSGENFDGHDFVDDAVRRGATGLVVDREVEAESHVRVYRVDDTRVALGRIARARRDCFDGPVIAVTGTNGKTSTKEFISAALSGEYVVHRTPANDNNLVGVPLTILGAPASASALVVEVGASEPGEIGRLKEVVHPDIGVVTNVGNAHLEGFGSVAEVLREKVSLLDGVPIAVVGEHPPELARAARDAAGRVIVAGVGGSADVRAESISLAEGGGNRFLYRDVRFEIPVPGRHLVGNAMIAIAVAELLGLPLDAACRGLGEVEVPGSRTRLLQIGDITVLDDCYNANPESTVAAIETAGALAGQRRQILVLGSMLELGQQTTLLHREVAHRAIEAEPDIVIAVGEFAPAFEATAGYPVEVHTAGNSREAGKILRSVVKPGDFVLLKGSRGVKLEVAMSMLRESQE